MRDELVVLMVASDVAEAHVIQAVLGAADIPAVVEGDALMDEWAVSQRLMGRIGVEVKVPMSRVSDAHAALEDARSRGAELAQIDDAVVDAAVVDDAEEEILEQYYTRRRWPPSALFTVIALLCSSAYLFVKWREADHDVRLMLEEGLYRSSWSADGSELRLTSKRTGEHAITYHNADGDLIWEQIDVLVPGGEIVSQSFDADEDGVYELTQIRSPSTGKIVYEYQDANGDGFPDRLWIRSEDGAKTIFEDANENLELDAPRTIR